MYWINSLAWGSLALRRSFKGDPMRDEVTEQMSSGKGGKVRGSKVISQMQEIPTLGISTHQPGKRGWLPLDLKHTTTTPL